MNKNLFIYDEVEKKLHPEIPQSYLPYFAAVDSDH